MKSPWTSNPCSCRRSAATAESTPPERATMTREVLAGVGAADIGEFYRAPGAVAAR
jgi:hypothetical protein